MNASETELLHADLIQQLTSVLAGDVSLIDGVRSILALRLEVTRNVHDSDFVVFVAVDSESHEIPPTTIREQCDPGWLAVCDEKARDLEARYATELRAACKRLMERFSRPATPEGRS